MNSDLPKQNQLSRRNFVRSCAAGAATLAAGPLWSLAPAGKAPRPGPAHLLFALDHDWLFGGKVDPGLKEGHIDDGAFTKVTLPHCVAKLSWQDWDPASWQDVFLYRRRFSVPKEFANRRVFLKFEGVMVSAGPSINGTALPTHQGGYLPFTYELTSLLKASDNVIDLKVDSRFQNVPPEGSPRGTHAVDYYLPGGIIRGVSLYAVPQVFLSDIFAKPVDVLKSTRRVEIACCIDAVVTSLGSIHLESKLMDGTTIISSVRKEVTITQAGKTDVTLTLSSLGNVKLWDVDAPHLYDLVTTLSIDGEPVHDYRSRIGFREAKFTVDGFFLNGRRLRLFGLNRHEIYPYVGYAMPPRVMRRDAEIIRNEFNCNIVRCSHYPQAEAFLEACDELGLMVWEETPGWQYIGADDAYQDQVVQNVGDMIRRDRNHASIVIWGVRVNESADVQPLYRRTTALAKSLDDSRPDSGSMTHTTNWETDWHEDVFAMDDYHQSPDGTVQILPPLPGVPYMLAETVGQRTYTVKGFDNVYRRAGDVATQYKQAIYHAQAHDRALAYSRFCGVIAWCAFEYGSPNNSHKGVKNPGVADVFRIPKLGASFYQSQVSPVVRPVIMPNFYWDFGPATPRGPGSNAAIFSNCDRLELFLDGKPHSTLQPDRTTYPNLKSPPFFAALDLDGADHPELRIDGYVADRLALFRSFSADAAKDQFVLTADDSTIDGDGVDATRLVFQIVDKFGAPRAFAGGDVSFELTGPGILVGDNPFSLTESGGAGAVWVKASPASSGKIVLKAVHSTLGSKSVTVEVEPDVHTQRI
jgi:beta-galactosidase